MAALEYEMDSRWGFSILHALFLHHSATRASFISGGPVLKILLAAVKCSFELHTDTAVENAEVRAIFSSKLQRVWQSFGALRARSNNVWFHPVKPVIGSVCLFKSKYLSVTMPSPFPPCFPMTAFFFFFFPPKKWDHIINKSGQLTCKQWQTVWPCWNYKNESLDKWPFSLFTALIGEYIWS